MVLINNDQCIITRPLKSGAHMSALWALLSISWTRHERLSYFQLRA